MDCRARDNMKDGECSLGYNQKIKTVNINERVRFYGLIPTEECPKPRSYVQLSKIRRLNEKPQK